MRESLPKTLSSQDSGAPESSGGIKRPHSDSSTHLWKNSIPKTQETQVHIGLYKDAVVGIKMAVIHRRHPDVKMDQTQVDMIQAISLSAVDESPMVVAPSHFLYSNFAQGVL